MYTVIVIALLGVFLLVLFKITNSKKTKTNSVLTNSKPEINVKEEPEFEIPLTPTGLSQIPIPLDDEPEMPIKPNPMKCKKASFLPAPETFSYYDCCGNLHTGEGYQPWEKRTPVSINVVKDFVGMEILDEDGEIDCEENPL